MRCGRFKRKALLFVHALLDEVERSLEPRESVSESEDRTRRASMGMDPEVPRPMEIEDLMYSRRGGPLMTDHERIWWEAHGGPERLLRKIVEASRTDR